MPKREKSSKNGSFRFAFDLGSGSLGWAVYRLGKTDGDVGLRPCELMDLGARIFPSGREPKSNESNAAARRGPRQQRRMRDRRLHRQWHVARLLVKYGLMPKKEDTLARDAFFIRCPYQARANCVAGKADLYDLGRAIWHIAKHRGFKSNRKTDAGDNESGKIKEGIAKLEKELAGKTYGQWLAARNPAPPKASKGEWKPSASHGVRVRPQTGAEATELYEFYPQRDMLVAEFDAMWDAQSKHHPALKKDGVRGKIRRTLFRQRPLQEVEAGRCTFKTDEPRLPRWHPLAQEFLILQDVNNLRIGDEARPLDDGQRDKITRLAKAGEKLTGPKLRKELKLPSATTINLLHDKKPHLAFDEVVAKFVATKKHATPINEYWAGLDAAKRLAILTILTKHIDTIEVDETEGDIVICRLKQAGLDDKTAKAVEAIRLPDGYIHIGETVAGKILPFMRHGKRYDEACKMAGYHHSDLRSEAPGLDRLPYYNTLDDLQARIGFGTGNPKDLRDKRFGRINNPTVHVALNQFRRVMNALIDRYGKPVEVVLETTRDLKKSAKELSEVNALNAKNKKANDARRSTLEKHGYIQPGQRRIGDHLLRMRLYEELGDVAACPYTGEVINMDMLFTDKVAIDHILPYAETFDDSPTNKTLCMRGANDEKGNRTPYQAWGHNKTRYDAIRGAVKSSNMPQHKQERFGPNALEDWRKNRGFEDSQLIATGYIARVVRIYAQALFDRDKKSNVWILPGRMTAMLRRRLGAYLPDHNAKQRDDYRHHALDAAIIGVIDRGMILRLQSIAGSVGSNALGRIMDKTSLSEIEPFANFGEVVRDRVKSVIASHRANHSISGKLHDETSYGEVKNADQDIGNLVYRVPLDKLTKDMLGKIRDKVWREKIQAAVDAGGNLAEWSKRPGNPKSVRVLKKKTARSILGRTGKPSEGKPYRYLIPGENAYMDIFAVKGKWVQRTTSIWSANDKNRLEKERAEWEEKYPNAEFVMRLFKGDTVRLFDAPNRRGRNPVMRVKSLLDKANSVRFVDVNDARDSDSIVKKSVSVDQMRRREAQRVRIDPLGRLRTVPHGKL